MVIVYVQRTVLVPAPKPLAVFVVDEVVLNVLPTGISTLKTVAESNATAVFDLNGRRMRSDVAGQKGIRLVRLADGTVRKLFFK